MCLFTTSDDVIWRHDYMGVIKIFSTTIQKEITIIVKPLICIMFEMA